MNGEPNVKTEQQARYYWRDRCEMTPTDALRRALGLMARGEGVGGVDGPHVPIAAAEAMAELGRRGELTVGDVDHARAAVDSHENAQLRAEGYTVLDMREEIARDGERIDCR